MANKDQGLKVELVGGLLTISIGVSELCGRLSYLSPLRPGAGAKGAVVTDEDAFARSLVRQLERVDDRGIASTHHLLSEAAEDAIAGGAAGVRLLESA